LGDGDRVAFEEPGYTTARQVLLSHGATIVPVPVDADGMQVQLLPSGTAAPPLAYVTPSHQYPLGARLSFGRRLALLDWARANDSLIVEDDYDSEFRFDAPPLPALAGMDTEGRVAYVGPFSKLLSPALRIGYVVAPRRLLDRIAWLKLLTDHHAPWPLQRALASFVGEGHLERHVRRMRRHYAAKRAALIAALCRALRGGLLELTGEVLPGMPRARLLDGGLPGLPIVTKAGGFGPRDALTRAIASLRGQV
jgi:GntR family transcriptional regulator/MocR family aminotransferase